jgi:adenosyl cobinamide kinase/adenosyl cobinamide phosphate guanylyltransferase
MAARYAGPVTYVATGVATDADMAHRIARHQARRPAEWSTAEVGTDLVRRLTAIDGLALVDSLGTWVASSRELSVDAERLCTVLRERRDPTILVSEEVGMGVHAATEAGRRFTDVLGELNRAVADIADQAVLVVAGRGLPLTPVDYLPPIPPPTPASVPPPPPPPPPAPPGGSG